MSGIGRHIVKARCSVCHEIVYADQGYHGISMDHYDCHKAHEAPLPSVDEIISKGDAAMEGMFAAFGKKPKKPRIRSGEGKLAQHVRQLVINALEEKFGVPVKSAEIWLQEGAYRGQKWDLDSWGIDAHIGGEGNLLCCCSSLAPMGDYRSCKKVILSHTDMHNDTPHGYDISVPNKEES